MITAVASEADHSNLASANSGSIARKCVKVSISSLAQKLKENHSIYLNVLAFNGGSQSGAQFERATASAVNDTLLLLYLDTC